MDVPRDECVRRGLPLCLLLWKQTGNEGQSIGEWPVKLQDIHAPEYYTVVKKNALKLQLLGQKDFHGASLNSNDTDLKTLIYVCIWL